MRDIGKRISGAPKDDDVSYIVLPTAGRRWHLLLLQNQHESGGARLGFRQMVETVLIWFAFDDFVIAGIVENHARHGGCESEAFDFHCDIHAGTAQVADEHGGLLAIV